MPRALGFELVIDPAFSFLLYLKARAVQCLRVEETAVATILMRNS